MGIHDLKVVAIWAAKLTDLALRNITVTPPNLNGYTNSLMPIAKTF